MTEVTRELSFRRFGPALPLLIFAMLAGLFWYAPPGGDPPPLRSPLIEEPGPYLRPQAQRYLYRLLREFSLVGNQTIYSTHSPAFLNIARLDELVFVERLPHVGTRALQPEAVSADEDFRVMTEFDAARSELFLARAVVLVEGLTEKLVLSFVFAALGHDVDREAISIIECGGKPNLPLVARICRATGLPFVVLHDSDKRAGGGSPRPGKHSTR